MKSIKNTTHVRPYDDSMWDQWIIYDKKSYQRDSDVCCDISRISGNLIKSSRCHMKDPYELKY